MSSRIKILEKRKLDFTRLVSGTSSVVTLAERIPMSGFLWGTLELRVHSSDLSGGSITFDLYGDSTSPEDPSISFLTGAPLIPSLTLPAGAPYFSTWGGRMLTEQALLRVTASKTSTTTLTATVSADLVLRESLFSPRDISGCVLWLDMLEPPSYTVTPGAPGTVTSINNLISGVNWTETTNPPEYEATGLNGKSCMRGNGSTRRLISTDPAVVAAFKGADRAQTIIVATQPMTAAPLTYRVSVGAANSTVSTNGAGYGGRIVTTGRFRYERTDDTGAGTGPTRSVDAALVAQVVTYITPGATASIFVNNELTPDPKRSKLRRRHHHPRPLRPLLLPRQRPRQLQ